MCVQAWRCAVAFDALPRAVAVTSAEVGARPDQKGLGDSPRARSRKRFSSPTSTRQHGRAGGRNGPTLVWKGTRSRCPDSRATRSQKCGSGTTVTTRPPRPRLLVRPALVRVAQPYPTSDGRSPAHSPRGIEDPPTSELRSGTDSPFVQFDSTTACPLDTYTCLGLL